MGKRWIECAGAAVLAVALAGWGPVHAQSRPAAAPAAKAHAAAHEPFEITLQFLRTHHGETASDKTYVLLATSGETLPAIRDDAKFRTNPDDADEVVTGKTDVDILALRRSRGQIFIGLRISTETIGTGRIGSLPRLPVTGTHQYVIAPTIPLGRFVTVYRFTDARYDDSTNVRVKVSPYRAEDAR